MKSILSKFFLLLISICFFSVSLLAQLSINYTVVGGGGGAGSAYPRSSGGGGGSGGVVTTGNITLAFGTYTATVGTGGAFNTNGNSSSFSGSSIATITASGGSKGSNATNGVGGAGGNNGTGYGSGGKGLDYNLTSNNGGNGVLISSLSTATYFGGGGGGGNYNGSPAGYGNYGLGATGNGTTNDGGGARGQNGNGGGVGAYGAADPGIVIIRYAANAPLATGGTITSYTGNGTNGTSGVIYQVHTFTSGSNNFTLFTIKTVGSTGADYPSLNAAFAAINNGTLTGQIAFQIIANTTESTTAVLYASGTGSSNYSSVFIYPTVDNLTISGNLITPLVYLNGADNVTIDGRAATTNLTIVNTYYDGNMPTLGQATTITFENDATYNQVKYSNINGSAGWTSQAYSSNLTGIIFFGTTSGTGNDNNLISYNNITTANDTYRPKMAIYSIGSGTTGSENSNNTISNNNIYNFLHRNQWGSYGIYLNTGNSGFTISGNSFYETTNHVGTNTSYEIITIYSGNNHQILNNYIGGSAPQCGGTAWTKGGNHHHVTCIQLSVGSVSPSSIQGNVISNFSWNNNSGSRNFTGINIATGDVNIGTTSSNTIGSSSISNSILMPTYGQITGISNSSNGIVRIENNIISNLTNSSAQNIYGITCSNSTGLTTIVNNKIQSLTNTYSSFAGQVFGINFSGSTSNNTIDRNFINNLTVSGASSTSANIYGMYKSGGNVAITNNVINIGGNTNSNLFGIYESGTANNNSSIYFNSINISGSLSAGSTNSSYALYSYANTNNRDFRNNILNNSRSTSGGSNLHYSIGLNYSNSSGLILNYNDYYISGTAGVLGFYNATNITSLPIVVGMDINSVSINPNFSNPSNSDPNGFLSNSSTSLIGLKISNYLTDYYNYSRMDIPTIGAIEYSNIWNGSQDNIWSNVNNWVSSNIPSAASKSIIPNNIVNNPSITSSVTIDANSLVYFSSTTRLTVNSNITIASGGKLILSSDVNGTASIANSTGTISGNVTVERYISAKRAWRFLSVPLTGSSNNSIFYNWQNNGSAVANYGVELWAPTGTTAPSSSNNGMALGGATNIKAYNSTSNGWDLVTNTNTSTLFDGTTNKAYGVFVTGPFTTNSTGNIYTGATATTLKATGTLIQGTHTKSLGTATAGQYFLVGNPYASALDPKSISLSNIANNFYMWDPNCAGTYNSGQYTTYNRTANTYALVGSGSGSVYTSGSSNVSTDNTAIQSGQAIFVQASAAGTTSLTFSESNKVSGSSNVFRTTSTDVQTLRHTLKKTINGELMNIDGALGIFYNGGNAAVDYNDAAKFSNSTENIVLRRANSSFAIEERPLVTENDTLFVRLTNTNQSAYTLELTGENFTNTPGLTATLKDAYTNTNLPLSITDTNRYNFTVDANAASTGDRFMIVFKTNTTLPVQFTHINATQKGASVQVDWKVATEQNIKQYVVEKSTNGSNFTAIATQAANNINNSSYIAIDNSPITGSNYYRILSTDNSGKQQYSNVAVVKIGGKQSSISVYPNPVINNTMNFQLENIAKGNYTIQLVNTQGSVVMQTNLKHSGGSGTQSIDLPSTLSNGNYVLKAVDEKGVVFTEKVVLSSKF